MLLLPALSAVIGLWYCSPSEYDAIYIDYFPITFDVATCVCTKTIEPSEATIDGSFLLPGSVLRLDAATTPLRGSLTLLNLNGTVSNPIFLRTCHGPVTITSNDHRAALNITGSYIRIKWTRSFWSHVTEGDQSDDGLDSLSILYDVFSKLSWSFLTSTTIVSFWLKSPSSIFSERGSSMLFWMVRLRGRAP